MTQKQTAKQSQRGGKLKVVPAPKLRGPLPIRISPDLLDRVDAIRPDQIPREPFIRYILDLGLKQLEDEG